MPVVSLVWLIYATSYVSGQDIASSSSTTANRSIMTTFLEPSEIVVVAGGEPGILVDVLVCEGGYVTKGELLASLDLRVHQQVLRAAKLRASSDAKVQGAEAALKLQDLRKRNFGTLADSGHANPSELEKIRLDFAVAQSALDLAITEAELNKIEVDRIQAQIDQRKIIAPISGYITSLHRKQGEYLSAGEPKFATIVKLDSLKAKFFLTSGVLDGYQLGQKLAVYIAPIDREVEAIVSFISPLVDPDSGTARIEVTIANDDLRLRSGSVCFLGDRQQFRSLNEQSPTIKRQIPVRHTETRR